MKVRVKETGEIVCVPNSPTVQLMIKTGAVEPVQETPAQRQAAAEYVPPKTPAKWTVQEEDGTGTFIICWACTGCQQGGRFVGAKIDKAHLLRAWHCGHVGGEVPTQEVIDTYAAINKPSAPLAYPGQNASPENKDMAADLLNRAGREAAGVPQG